MSFIPDPALHSLFLRVGEELAQLERQGEEAQLRNQRFAAWRRAGVPVVAYWFDHGAWHLLIRCQAPHCGWLTEARARPSDVLAEVELTRFFDSEGSRRGCSHLLPLAGLASPEQQALFELELLAGG